jgi:hypothetical protein
MREQEMRECVGHFLKARMRAMLLPATLGLGLAVAGCDKEALETTDDSGTISQVEAGAGASHSDTRMDSPMVTPEYMAQMPDAGVATALYMAQMPDTGVLTKYMAQMPDTGVLTKYMAQMPDAREVGIPEMVLRYMAPLPKPDQPVLLYMAQYPGT